MSHEVVAIVPARNEAATIVQTIAALGDLEILVVDDHSWDDTATWAEKAGATVIRLGDPKLPPGKATAVWRGLRAIGSYDCCLLVDADLGETASAVKALIEPVLSGELDMAIGAPPSTKKGGFGLAARMARNYLLRKHGVQFAAPLSGQRCLSNRLVQSLKGVAPGYGLEVGLTDDALSMGFAVGEMPIDIRHRELGKTLKGFLHRGRQYLAIRRAIRGVRISP